MKIELLTKEYTKDWTSFIIQTNWKLPWNRDTYQKQVMQFLDDSQRYHPYLIRKDDKLLAIGTLEILNEKEGRLDHLAHREGEDKSLGLLIDHLLLKGRKYEIKEISAWLWDSEKEKIRIIEEVGFKSTKELALVVRRLSDSIAKPISKSLTISSLRNGVSIEEFVTANRIAFRDDDSSLLKVDELNEWLKEIPGFLPELQLVALSDGMIVGTVMSEFFEVITKEVVIERAWVYGLGVIAEWRRRGIGTSLLSELMKRLKHLGVEELWALTDTEGGVREFYDELGFIEKDRWKEFELKVQ